MADPVSWFVIEPGWKVVDAAGEDVGTVDEVVGDEENDIFNGLAISMSLLGKPRYVPAESVRAITEGRIELAMSKEALESLGEFKEPPTSAEILPEGASALRRAEARVEAPIHEHPKSVNIWRRSWWALRRLFR